VRWPGRCPGVGEPVRFVGSEVAVAVQGDRSQLVHSGGPGCATSGTRSSGVARLANERKDSPRRIDAAVAAVMAHDRAAALAGVTGQHLHLSALQPRDSRSPGP
jgi:hypothetical protein